MLTALLLGGLIASATALGGRTASSSRAVVKVAFNKTLKKTIVVDGNGRTLYMFSYDTTGKATCAAVYPACPKVWPAFTTTGKPLAGKGIKASLLGTTRGAGGTTQVTYNRHPLYHFAGLSGVAGDKMPGDVRGQDWLQVWYVLLPNGTPFRKLR